MTIHPSFRAGALLLITAIAFAIAPAAHAQVTPEQAKAAGAVPLSTVVLDKIEALLKKVGADPAAKAEYVAAGKDAGARPQDMTELVEKKYPKLAAVFKTSDLTPFEFMNATGSLFLSLMLSETGTPTGDKRADDNIAFCKANKDRVTATMNALEAIEKTSSDSSPSPSSSPDE